jgi:hypothetical protein
MGAAAGIAKRINQYGLFLVFMSNTLKIARVL